MYLLDQDERFGICLTNERQIIILLLLLYIIFNTENIYINIIYLVVFYVHSLKLYKNYKINKRIYKKVKRSSLIYNLVLLLSLILYLRDNNYGWIIFTFGITAYILRESINLYDKTIINGLWIIFGCCILFILYPNYKYRFIFLMEIINKLINYNHDDQKDRIYMLLR